MKMNIVIWGYGELGKCVFQILDRTNCYVMAFVDSNPALIGESIEGVPVVSYEELKSMSCNKKISVLVALRNAYNIVTVLKKLNNCRIEDLGIIKPRVLAKMSLISIGSDEKTGDIIWVKTKGKIYNVVPRLELNIVDGCNLNCMGCSHFSNLFSKDSMYQINEYENDLKQIRKLGKLVRLRLLGGEPFLAKNLDEYISIARIIFPEADIEIVTNGLLIPKMKQKILAKISENKVCISISLYKPTLRIKTEIEKILLENEIWWKFEGGVIDEFARNLTLQKKHDEKKSSENCLANGCVFLRNGILYKCPLEGLIFILEQKFNIQFYVSNRGINIYEEDAYNKMWDLIANPVEMCQYCLEKNEFFKWKIENKPILQDWICDIE